MGGYGSTRWNHHYRQHTTNESFSFDLAKVNIKARMQADERTAYLYQWTSRGKPSGSMAVLYHPDTLEIVFKFQTSKGDETRDILQRVTLETMPLHFGGVRYWMRCPNCQKRVRTLHSPSTGKLNDNPFRCRTCWNLSYYSCQESRHLSGKLYELWDTVEKIDKLNEKLRSCHYGSKNYHKYHAKLDKLQSQFDSLAELSEQKSAQFRVKYSKLISEMESTS